MVPCLHRKVHFVYLMHSKIQQQNFTVIYRTFTIIMFNLLNLVIVDRSVVLKRFILNILSISNIKQNTSSFFFRASVVYFAYFTQSGELGLSVSQICHSSNKF